MSQGTFTHWPPPGSIDGVNAMGSVDGKPHAGTGATIDGTTLYLQSATATAPGLMTTGNQTFAGDKTTSGSVAIVTGSPSALQTMLAAGSKNITINQKGAVANNAFVVRNEQTGFNAAEGYIQANSLSVDDNMNFIAFGSATPTPVALVAGNGGATVAPYAEIAAGNGIDANVNGGDVYIYAGNATQDSGSGLGGNISINAGLAGDGATQGTIALNGGATSVNSNSTITLNGISLDFVPASFISIANFSAPGQSATVKLGDWQSANGNTSMVISDDDTTIRMVANNGVYLQGTQIIKTSGFVYSPSTPTDWSGSPPTTVQEALDRIAAALGPIA